MTAIVANPDRNRMAAIAAKHGLRAILLGARLNRAYTPKACMAAASRVTGKQFKARDYAGAIAALEEYLEKAS